MVLVRPLHVGERYSFFSSTSSFSSLRWIFDSILKYSHVLSKFSAIQFVKREEADEVDEAEGPEMEVRTLFTSLAIHAVLMLTQEDNPAEESQIRSHLF